MKPSRVPEQEEEHLLRLCQVRASTLKLKLLRNNEKKTPPLLFNLFVQLSMNQARQVPYCI